MPSTYRKLIVYQRAKTLATDVCKLTFTFPKLEMYALGSQIRRAAVSVPSNIAEGQGQLTRAHFRKFLGTARGSLLELCTQLEIAHDLGYITPAEWKSLDGRCSEVLFLLNRLVASLKPRPTATSETSETFETSET